MKNPIAPPQHPRTVALTVIVALAPLACSDGQLGNTQITEPCAPTDAQCATRPIPPVAVGASTALSVQVTLPAGGEAPVTHLRVVDEAVALEEDGRVRAVGPGTTAVLFLTSDGRVLDFTHLAAGDVERLLVARGQDEALDPRGIEGTLLLSPGEAAPLTLLPMSDSQQLGGDLDAVITVSDARLDVRVDPKNGFTLRASDAAEAFTATLRAEALGLSLELPIEVRP
jgi:hypothetical protein